MGSEMCIRDRSNRERAVGRSSGRSCNKQDHVSVTDARTWAFHGQIQLFGETFTRLQCSLHRCHLILCKASLDPILYANGAWGHQCPTIYKPVLGHWAYCCSRPSEETAKSNQVCDAEYRYNSLKTHFFINGYKEPR